MSTEAESGDERSLRRELRFWEAIVPVIALAILLYVIYANVYPVPDFRES